MTVIISLLEEFERNFKRLAKKYRSLGEDFVAFKRSLEENPMQGDDLGGNVRKVRMAITSKGKGKSGGARVITFTAKIQDDGSLKITLLSIYDKNEIENVSDTYIKWLVQQIRTK
ncbi:MAG: type II toxin-antitoxin system RelE/ParE family toxin [Bacteroidales bacterium]|nr:type II toxin-antitoxin system RelE/ParE family toxin [Bacteroidales bacterium]